MLKNNNSIEQRSLTYLVILSFIIQLWGQLFYFIIFTEKYQLFFKDSVLNW